jgi:hypothetical protein
MTLFVNPSPKLAYDVLALQESKSRNSDSSAIGDSTYNRVKS